MKMDLLQPFIGSLDAVLAELLHAPVTIADVSMDEEAYRRKGIAAVVVFQGQIEGRVILDVDPGVATKVAAFLSGEEVKKSDPIVAEGICELANMVIGGAVTQLNDRGSQFKVLPPSILSETQSAKIGRDAEATVLWFRTPAGAVYLNVAMHYHTRRFGERSPVAIG